MKVTALTRARAPARDREKVGAGFGGTDARVQKSNSHAADRTGLTDKGKRASLQAWEEFADRCRVKTRAKR